MFPKVTAAGLYAKEKALMYEIRHTSLVCGFGVERFCHWCFVPRSQNRTPITNGHRQKPLHKIHEHEPSEQDFFDYQASIWLNPCLRIISGFKSADFTNSNILLSSGTEIIWGVYQRRLWRNRHQCCYSIHGTKRANFLTACWHVTIEQWRHCSPAERAEDA